ncbi:portal protein [Mesorhizobium sp. WSM4884]|uniref:portal protein n=1 Tax=Mesorhizobium sp. WSM4884 TaxID=3038542 RepID=UPI002416A62F|nr:portal protein [Mesorhizobium sp. WSM4884]MDG4883012.1 portal protein [Mesorhizobium sp. WSM4884]
MTDSRARDILSRQAELETERAAYEPVWEAVAEFCDPDAPDIWSGRRTSRGESQAERQERRGSRVYANTINSAANRLAAGLESLIIPQSEKWHGLTTAEMDDEESDEEKEWAESLRDFLFALRYSANSNFVPATQACLRNVVRYGPAYLYAEEGFGGTLIRYASIPVVEGYLSRNRWGQVDTFHRRYERTARQAAQLLGYEKLPARIRALVDDPAKCEEKISLIQCIEPRDERRMYRSGGSYQYLDAAFASYHVVEDEEEIVRESGFRTFPVSTFNWRRYEGDAYRKLTLTCVAGAGTLPTSADGIWLIFTRAGDKGADGTGVGDFSGPASSVTDNIVTFAGTTGKAGKDSGVAVGTLVAGPVSATSDNIATFNGATGKVVKDSGVAVSSLAPKASPAFSGTPTAPTQAAGDNSTKLATTAYVDTTFAPKASPTFTGTPAAPTASGGTNSTQLATTAFVANAISPLATSASVTSGLAAKVDIATAKLQGFYESAQQTWTNGGALTLAHGLGVKPKLYAALLVCQTAEGGYSVGDEVLMNPSSNEAGSNRGLSLVPDATNMNVRFGSGGCQITRKDTGAFLNPTMTNWKFVVRAWA